MLFLNELRKLYRLAWSGLLKRNNTTAMPFQSMTLYYGAPYELRPDKLETYSVEAINADLHHYLKRLARRSRCFSRRMKSLMENLRLFFDSYNQRQLAKRRFPKYSFHLVDFVSFPV